jgi:hypothetical protein
VLVAVLLGGVRNAGTALQSLPDRVPMEVAVMLEGAILLFALGSEVLVRYRIRWPWSRTGDEPRDPAPTAAGATAHHPAGDPASDLAGGAQEGPSA